MKNASSSSTKTPWFVITVTEGVGEFSDIWFYRYSYNFHSEKHNTANKTRKSGND